LATAAAELLPSKSTKDSNFPSGQRRIRDTKIPFKCFLFLGHFPS
jgi:hypothetical protein